MSQDTMQSLPEEQRGWALKPLLAFGELVDPEENRDYEEMFALFDIHKDFLETVLTKDKHWCLDRMEIFSEDDDSEYLDYCKSLVPLDLLTASSDSLVSLILSEAGGGKTCLLHHLWSLARATSPASAPAPSSPPAPRFTPIYAPAKSIFHCYMRDRGDAASAESGLDFAAMMRAIAEAAVGEFQADAAPVGGQEELLAILLGETPVLLLIDDLDLIPLEWVPVWIQFFKESATLCSAAASRAMDTRGDGDGLVSKHSFEGRTVLALRSDHLQGLQPFSRVEKMLKSVQCLELQPGFTFNFITTAQIRSLLKRWSAVRHSEAVQEGASQWVAFESALRAHRRKLYPSCTHSPLLMFILARRLAKGSLNDTEKGTDRQFNIFELLDSLFSDCLREEFLGAVPADAAVTAAKRSHDLLSGSDMEGTSDGDHSAMDLSSDAIMTPAGEDEEGEEEGAGLSQSKFPLLHEHGLDIAQLKRLCALVGFLCHWAVPRSLHKEPRPSRQKLLHRLPQREFICVQLTQLLAQEEIAGLLGFDHALTSARGGEHVAGILTEVFRVMRYFYDLSVDGRARVKHPLISEFLAGKFLTEPSYWCDLIMGSLAPTIEYDSRALPLRRFHWANSAFQTDWWWDGVYQFAGIRRGVTWLASKILQGSVYDSKYEGSPQTAAKRSTASAKETRNQIILEYYLRNLQSIGVDVEDLGQIRFQILLRVYSSICNHRTATENAADPVTEWIGKAFSGLVERSLTVFVHLEVFPNYFLSAFNSTICNNIVKRCISIFVKRSTHHAANIISKFQFSPYLKRHLPSLLEIYSRREPKTRLAIFNILRKVDEVTLEKSNIADMVQMLGDFDGNVRREVVTTLVHLGLASAAQIRQPLLNNLFVDGNPQPAISETISALTNLADCEDTMDTTPQQMLHSKHTSTITALLEQPDPGTRLLAYVCFGSPNFEHNADEDNGIPARKAALHVCVRLCSDNSVPLFASGDNVGAAQKMRGDYCYTVALNSLISESLGETAVCWVSSAMDLLKFKRFLIHKVSAKAFTAASEETRLAALDELLGHETSYVTHGQMFEVLLLTEPEHLVCCGPRLLEYIQQHVVQTSSTSPSVKVLAVKVYLHLARAYPTLGALSDLCKILLSHPPPLVIEATLVALETLSTLPGATPTTGDFELLLQVIQEYLRSPMHYVGTEAVKALGTLPDTLMDVQRIPVVEWLQRTTGSLRQACIYLMDKHPALFQGHIAALCELFLSAGGHHSCYIRSAAVSALACLSRRGYAPQVVATICQEGYLQAPTHPYYVNEAAVRVLSIIPPEHVTEEARLGVYELLQHRSHRVMVAVIDALGHFGHPFILEDARMERLAACLPHDDSEIRSAAFNALERLKPKFGERLNSTTPRVDALFGQYANSGIYYHRLAAVRLLTFYQGPVLKQHHDVLASLLQDTDSSVRIELLRALREVISQRDLFALLKGTLVELIEQKNSRSGLESQSLREVFRMVRCDEHAAKEMAPFAHQSLNLYFEDVQVKKQAVLLLALIDQLNGENVQSLVDMLKTSDAKILTEVANTFCRAGLPLVRLIPKMFGYMKGEHPTVKRKLLRFIAPFKEEVRDEYVQLYHQIITMTTDSDSVIRKKAAELLAMVACSLPSDLPDGLTNTVTNAIIEALVEICLDRNSFVRRESALSLSEIGASQPQFISAIHRKLLKSDEDPFSNILVWRLFSFRWGVLIEKQSRSK